MSAASRLADRLFAAAYDRLAPAGERGEQAERRAALLAGARGRVLELGAGTGLNLPLYGPDVTELVLTEPSPPMRARLERRLDRTAAPATVVAAGAESLPFAESTFDTVVATLVLCTVPDVPVALAEAARVLRPGGRLLFLEHVRAPEPRVARWQDRLQPAWGVVARGCHCNRDTAALLDASPLAVEHLERFAPPHDPPLVRPRITGAAVAR